MTPGVADTLRLERQCYRLTDRGRQATESITRAVGAQLSGVTDSVKR
jgi:DNA-binding PadR family transcriptional regulator